MSLEFIPQKQVATRLSEGWEIVSKKRGDYAALMQAPEGWEPIVGAGESISLLYRVDGTLKRLDGKKPFKRQGIHIAVCRVPECDGKHEGLGYCRKHYLRFKATGHPQVVRPPGMKPYGKCDEVGCRSNAKARGLCNKHWKRLRKAEKAAFECREAA